MRVIVDDNGGRTPLFTVMSGRLLVPVPVPPCTERLVIVMVVVATVFVTKTVVPALVVSFAAMTSHSATPFATAQAILTAISSASFWYTIYEPEEPSTRVATWGKKTTRWCTSK